MQPTRDRAPIGALILIPGLLLSLGPKTLDDIQRNLENFGEGYSHSMDDLRLFMQNAQHEGLVLAMSDGKWKLL